MEGDALQMGSGVTRRWVYSQAEADEAADYQKQLFDVGTTGDGLDDLHQNTLKLRNRRWFARFFETKTPSAKTLRWRWQHVYSFDSIPNAAKVHSPVLGLFGELDTSTPSKLAIANMEQALREGGNVDITVRIFQHANHSLTVAATGADEENNKAPELEPGVFVTIRERLQKLRVGHS